MDHLARRPNQNPVEEYEKHRPLWDFEIQMDHLANESLGKWITWQMNHLANGSLGKTTKPEPVGEYEKHRPLWDFEIQMDHLANESLGKTTKSSVDLKRKKQHGRLINFAILLDHRLRLKENKKKTE